MAEKKNLIIYKDEFIKLYKEGNSLRKIGEMYGVSKNSVGAIIKKHMELRPKSSVAGKEEEAYNLYKKGYTASQIAKKLNVNYSGLVSFFAKEHGINVEVNKKYIELLPKFKEDYSNGMSLTEISQKYGINRATIYNYLIQENIDMRTYSETSRKYELDENYFDDLNDKKAYQLGIIFEIGTAIKGNSSHIIRLSFKRNIDIIFEAVDEITEKDEKNLNTDPKTGVKILDLNSEHLYNKIIEYGINSNKVNIQNCYMDNFIRGYLKPALRICSKKIYISLGKSFEQSIEYYLKEDLAIKLSKQKYFISIGNKDGISKLINKFPEIKDKIKTYLEENPDNKYWRRLI